MNILRYTHVFFMIIVWLFALFVIKPKRIKELWPIAVLSLLLLFSFEEFLISLTLYQFNKPLVNIFGTPLYHLLWGAGSGIIFIYYLRKYSNHKILVTVVFTLLTFAFEYSSQKAGVASRLNGYSSIHQIFLEFTALVMLLFLSESFFSKRLQKIDILQR